MGRYLGANCRLCRREGTKLFLKGHRCNTEKCAMAKRPNPPGMHIRRAAKASYYSMQLREKQKVKRSYGMVEQQFRRFFRWATKAKGMTGRMLIQLLELRLDNVIFRALLASSRKQARQMVRHGLVFINGKRMNIPSHFVKMGDELTIVTRDSVKQTLKATAEAIAKERSVPTWLNADMENLKIKVVRLPEKEDLNIAINEQLIVELYSK